MKRYWKRIKNIYSKRDVAYSSFFWLMFQAVPYRRQLLVMLAINLVSLGMSFVSTILVKPGEIVGVVGPSGAGKTTLIRLLLSLIQPDDGTIEYIDEKGNREFAQPASRRFISYVPQGNTLMSGTIERNLRTGKKDATDEEIWEALRMADAEKFVRKSDKGLKTMLTEKAGGLSEGQAQRIAIARALIRKKPLLILDEATSALDEDAESRILSEISEKYCKTCFIITHRRSMLKYCDRVIEIDESSVCEKDLSR